ncbi:MAG TPA: hypothetical protein VN222_13240, partial [Novosphingobium sp.]|nr:hypothetical protein [Novosphingobium sp.]
PLAKPVAQRPLSPAAMEAEAMEVEAMAAPLSAAAEADESLEDLTIESHAAAPVQAAAAQSDDVQSDDAQGVKALVGEAQDVAEPAPSVRTGFPTASGPTAAERIAGAPLDALSHIELVERLAIAMQRRRETLAATQADEASRQEAPAQEAVAAPATDARAEADAAPARAAGSSVRTAFGIDAAALRRRIEEMPAFQVGNSPANNNGAAMALSRVANGHGSLAGTEASLRAALASLQEIR